MSQASDECCIIIKAHPHRSSKYFETVCCAGIGRDLKWRRQYPVPFRNLEDSQQFRRWDWISYNYTESSTDRRVESQKVVPESVAVCGHMKAEERTSLITPILRASFREADEKDESLTLIRPLSFSLRATRKTVQEVADETEKHRNLANQLSFLDRDAAPLKVCPVKFEVIWKDADGNSRRHQCDDWETSAAYNRFSATQGEANAIATIVEKYDQYFRRGLVFGFSTHSRRNKTNGADNQWLLVGMIRLDVNHQGAFSF